MIRGCAAPVVEVAGGLPVTAFVRVRLRPHGGRTVAAIGRMDAVLDRCVSTGDADRLPD